MSLIYFCVWNWTKLQTWEVFVVFFLLIGGNVQKWQATCNSLLLFFFANLTKCTRCKDFFLGMSLGYYCKQVTRSLRVTFYLLCTKFNKLTYMNFMCGCFVNSTTKTQAMTSNLQVIFFLLFTYISSPCIVGALVGLCSWGTQQITCMTHRLHVTTLCVASILRCTSLGGFTYPPIQTKQLVHIQSHPT